jgi:glycosyltransferase involved in cell wall biosynthesis
MNNNPKVSVIIPVYNGSNYLKEAIDSALAQTYKNIEIIVINDGSNDNGATENVAKTFGNKIRYYKKVNGGVATALNLGIKKMTGDYFSWLSHDDMYEKRKVEDQIRYIGNLNEKEVITASNIKVLFPSGVKKKVRIDSKTFNFIDIFLSTSAMVGVNGCSLLIPAKAFKDCGVFNTALSVTQDYDLWFRMKNKYRFVLINKFHVISRRHREQDSVTKQKLLFEAGDRLHYEFLKRVSYERFEEYFKQGKHNLKYAYKNYRVYLSRGYTKTASAILKNILGFYYENDKKKFYDTFNSELLIGHKARYAGPLKRNGKITHADKEEMELEYTKIKKVPSGLIPLMRPISTNDASNSMKKALKFIKQISEVLVYDGPKKTITIVVNTLTRKINKKR